MSDELQSYTYIDKPLCLTCGSYIFFTGDVSGYMVTGKCACPGKDRVLTVDRFEVLETLGNPVAVTVLLEHVPLPGWDGSTPGGLWDMIRVVEGHVRATFGDVSELDRDVFVRRARELRGDVK